MTGMGGFLFGTKERPLFGYYHEPRVAPRGSVLLCQPWGIEYQYAHRTMRFLAKRLAQSGWHVLRFDYAGTGDSWGDTTAADLPTWLGDVGEAARELRVIAGIQTLGLAGLRLGGTLAAMALDYAGEVDRLVLWDPIVSGPAWVEELGQLSPPEPWGSSIHTELGRHTVSRAFIQQLSEIEMTHSGVGVDRTLLLWTASQEAPETWARGVGTELTLLPQPSPWIEDTALGAGQIPIDAVAKIVDWLGS